MLTLDGWGGGRERGRMLRAALALSLWTGEPFRVRLAGGRGGAELGEAERACVRAAAEVGGAEVRGDAPGERELCFLPQFLRGGRRRIRLGGEGDAGEALLTVLLPLLRASEASTVIVEGPTHREGGVFPETLAEVYAPLLRRMGAELAIRPVRIGFPPAGGVLEAQISPAGRLEPLELMKRGPRRSLRATALVSRMPAHLAGRQLRVVETKLAMARDDCRVRMVSDAAGAGCALLVRVEAERVTELFGGVDREGARPEALAVRVAEEARRYLRARVPVGPRLAETLLLALAFAGGGRFRTLAAERPLRVRADLIRRFLGLEIGFRPAAEGACDVLVGTE